MEWTLMPVSPPEETVRALAACNQRTERFGLTLSPRQMATLASGRREALRSTGRVEFGEGILPRLIHQFCDSPYVDSETWAETLEELQGLFYCFKNEFPLSDEDLLAAMRAVFDGPAHGALELLPDRLPGYLAGEDAEREVRDD